MELSQVSGAVRDRWDFLWPPIVLLALLLLFAWFVGRTAVGRSRTRWRYVSAIPAQSLF